MHQNAQFCFILSKIFYGACPQTPLERFRTSRAHSLNPAALNIENNATKSVDRC